MKNLTEDKLDLSEEKAEELWEEISIELEKQWKALEGERKYNKKEEHPDYRICVVDNEGNLKRSGALWIRKKQEQEIEGKLVT